MSDTEYLGQVNQFFSAYNAFDIQVLTNLLHDDIQFEHRNRFKGQGRSQLLASIEEFAQKVPRRGFSGAQRWAVQDITLFLELDCLSLLTFERGKFVEWIDYA